MDGRCGIVSLTKKHSHLHFSAVDFIFVVPSPSFVHKKPVERVLSSSMCARRLDKSVEQRNVDKRLNEYE